MGKFCLALHFSILKFKLLAFSDVGSSPAILDSNEVQDVVPQLDFKKRKLTSEVHEHFSLMQDKLHFKCKYCR